MFSKYLKVSCHPVSIRCKSNISHVWDTLWNEAKERIEKRLFTVVTGEPLEELSSNHHRYDDFPHFEECYILPPIVFYSTPNVTVLIDSDVSLSLGDTLVLTCHVTNVAPVQHLTIRWLRGDRLERTASYSERSINNSNVIQYNIFDSMAVPLNKEENGEMYTCQAELNLESYTVIRRNASIRVSAESLLDFDQWDFNFALFCEMDLYPHGGHVCKAARNHSSKRMHFKIYLMESAL
ncbi:uncharacterized protein LOC127590364 [Hippocampus zosterae]|uniref:uncharacterized protein LOC127590364 n=1 Tax=Hippocampus zosterae TaxID=109293 RepID=UPI00223D2402|nr:uncharacterized protein LOC127590364 [Hippocampus zosterae]